MRYSAFSLLKQGLTGNRGWTQAWRKAEPKLFITRAQYFQQLEGWDIETVEFGGAIGAITITKGPEMHFVTLDTGKPIPRRVVGAVLQKIIDRHGYSLTKTPKDDHRQHRFNRLIGYFPVGEDLYDIHYRIERPRLGYQERTGSCLS